MRDYEELVRSITKEAFEDGTYSSSFEYGDVPLDEVNAWTYWQGLGVRKCKILVIGQDWGSKKKSQRYLDAIAQIQKHGNPTDKVYYFGVPNEHRGFPTDEKLAELFKLLGKGYEIKEKHYDDLFFTNLIPGFRKGPESSSGFRKSWVTDKVKSDLKDLVDILEPRIIICLGKYVFEEVARIYDNEEKLKGHLWNDYLDDKDNHFKIPNGKTEVFPVAHPGAWGQRNRKNKKSVEKDWKRIGKYMKEEKL